MKAITCSQCGALIKGISLKKEFAVCDYCGAEMQLKHFEKKIIEIPENIPQKVKTETNWEIYLKQRDENRKRYAQMSEPTVETHFNFFSFFLPIIVIFFVFVLPVVLYFSFNKSVNPKYQDFKVTSEVSYPYGFRAEDLKFPKIYRSNITETDVEELRELPVEKREAIVKVRIDKKGYVIVANGQSANQLLRESAEDAARKTTFYPPGEESSIEMTYKFFYR